MTDKIYTADTLITKRRNQWSFLKSEKADSDLCRAFAMEIVRNPNLVSELRHKPEKLIEMMFLIPNKKRQTVPFFLNKVQADFVKRLQEVREDYDNKKISSMSIMVLKGRQQGFTSLITAYQLACTLLSRNFEGMTVADDVRNAETIFENKAKFILDRLPSILHPSEKYNNRRELRFSRLNSGWNVETAGRQLGRSRTINFIHGSECAFWKCGIAPVQAALGEALTPDCIKIFESTANGFNDYHEMWQSGAHVTLFYPWWYTEEYRLEFADANEKRRFNARLKKRDSWLYRRLKWLKEQGLSAEQLYWYSEKYKSYLDKSLIRQEYPCSPDDAFISSGRCVFDNEAIMQRKSTLKPPLSRGEFSFERASTLEKPCNTKYVEGSGDTIIYKKPEPGVPYVIGGDIAGEGSECFCAQVLDNRSGEQVAVYHTGYDEAAYAQQLYCLGRYYNDALIASEVNTGIYANELLRSWGYPRMFRRQRVDRYSGRDEPRYGFKTTSITRPLIISGFVTFCKEGLELIHDEGTLDEMLSFVRNENGREEHRRGATDDRIMAYSIALFAGGQQSKIAVQQTTQNLYTADMLEDYLSADEETRQMMRGRFGTPQVE